MDKLGNITLYNADCMDLLRQMPDKAYDVAIVDPPYGIGVTKMTLGNGQKKVFRGNFDWDRIPPPMRILRNYNGLAKTKLYGARTTLLAVCRMIVRVGLFGINVLAKMILLIVNWLGLLLEVALGNLLNLGLGTTQRNIRRALDSTLRRNPLRSTNGYSIILPKRAIRFSTLISAAVR